MSYNSFRNDNNGAGEFALIQFRKSNNFASVANLDLLGQILWSGYDATTSTYKSASYIYCQAVGAPAGNVPSELQFNTSFGTGTQLAMTIGQNGQVTINNPNVNQATLFVTNDQTSANINLRSSNATPTTGPHIQFTRSRVGAADVQPSDDIGRLEFKGFQGGTSIEAADIRAQAQTVNGASVSGSIQLRTRPTTYAAINTRMNISADGFVTINAPAAAGSALTVNGVNSAANYSLISQAAVAGGIHNAARLWNYDGTAGSATQVSIDVFNQLAATGGDPSLRFLNIGIRAVTLGIDSSTDQFVIANSSALGSGNILTWTASNNQINLPLQCSFHAWISTAQLDVTGDSTSYNVIFQTERHDVSSSYDATTGVFTAPITGKYMFTSQVIYEGLTAGMTWGALGFWVNGASYVGGVSYVNPVAAAALGTFYSNQGTVIMNISAGDTVQVRIFVTGGAKVVDLNLQTASFFAGQLLS